MEIKRENIDVIGKEWLNATLAHFGEENKASGIGIGSEFW